MKTSNFTYLIRRIRRRIPAILLLCAAHIGSAILGVLFALGTKNVINTAISGDTTAFYRACLVQAAIIIGSLICITLQRWLHDRLAADLDRDWKRDLLGSLLRGDYAAVSDYHTGELINRLGNDVRIVNEGLLTTLPGLLTMITRLGAIVLVLDALDRRFTTRLAILALAVIAVTGFARKMLKDLHKAVSTAEGAAMGFMQEVLEKLLLIQAMNLHEAVEDRAADLLEARYDLQRRRRKISLLANSGVSTLSQLSAFGALVWCASGVLKGAMTFGDLTAITQLVGQLRAPMVNLSGILPRYTAMMASLERLKEIDSLRWIPQYNIPIKPHELYRITESIEATNLWFGYDSREEALIRAGRFSIPKGSFVVITGPSGSGKSTLLKLMLGIYTPTGGELILRWYGGESFDLDRMTRGLFAYVPQGNLIFSGTLRENLLLTRPEATEEEIEKAIFVSGMDRFLPTLPDGLDTILGENAHGLSEGQAQRLSIARAVLSGAPILLLDECTSALDAETEQTVLQRLRALEDKTCIAVTHRPAALELADAQLEFRDGRIEQKNIDS